MDIEEWQQTHSKEIMEGVQFLRDIAKDLEAIANKCRDRGFNNLSVVLIATLVAMYRNSIADLRDAITPFMLEEKTRLAFERKKGTGSH